MRHHVRFMGGTAALLLSLLARGYAGVPAMDVTVSDASGKVAFKGSTDAEAVFATPRLSPGRYVVQFKTKNGEARGNQYLAVVSAGKTKVVATAVPGETFINRGAAIKINLERPLKITGQLANEHTLLADRGLRRRVVNGERFVWVTANLGSNLGGRWVEESLGPALNTNRVSIDSVHRLQESAGEGNLINYYQRNHR